MAEGGWNPEEHLERYGNSSQNCKRDVDFHDSDQECDVQTDQEKKMPRRILMLKELQNAALIENKRKREEREARKMEPTEEQRKKKEAKEVKRLEQMEQRRKKKEAKEERKLEQMEQRRKKNEKKAKRIELMEQCRKEKEAQEAQEGENKIAQEALKSKKIKNTNVPAPLHFITVANVGDGLLPTPRLSGLPNKLNGETMSQTIARASVQNKFLGAILQNMNSPKKKSSIPQGTNLLGNNSASSVHVLETLATASRVKSNQSELNFYSNWTLFHKCALEFFESQRALLAMISAENFDDTSGIKEGNHLYHRISADILQRVKSCAGDLQSAQVTILSQYLMQEKTMNEQLQNELKKLKDEASEFTLLTDSLDHSELAERLEFQTARLADKESQIAELKERLAFQNRETDSDTKPGIFAISADTDEDSFQELSTEAVLDLAPRSLIKHIRKELGIGMESFNPIQRRIMRAMRSKLGCALEKLAHDIYSNDSQIVLELIQNADDNYYNEIAPFLSMHIRSEKSIFVTNNEIGFNNANVIAISNIGGSTKKDVSRFTGHKGIGFKSVFKVTRTPYIISKDFCFRFNLDGANMEDNIGYILPEWVEREEVDSLITPEQIDPNMTHFYFPLSESSRFPAEELYQGIDIIPLFLRQLHHIELGLDQKKKVVIVSKQPRQIGLLEIYHLLVTEHTAKESGDVTTEVISDVKYRVYRKMLDVPKDLQIDPAGRMIPVKTELILAFPTVPDNTIDPREVEIQKVFSFLPVEKAGFRFLIQADFHLVSSRDRVHAQSLYNRWLSMMIPTAFKEAFGLGDNSANEVRAGTLRNDLFLFLPTPYELTRISQSETSTDGFWRRVMKGIRDKVLDTPCVLTETSKWAKPDQVCVRPKGYEDLFTNSELQTSLNKEWVSKNLAEEAVYGLGCQYLSPFEALTIINHPSFCVTNRPTQWFYRIYGFLGSQIKNKSDFIDQIFLAKMFPLDSGAITCLQAGRLYTMTSPGLYKIGSHVLRLLALDSEIFFPGDPAQKFLESVGITSMTPLDVANSIWVEHQRLKKPISGVAEYTTKTSGEQFWEQLRFLKDHWSEIGSLYPYLESKLLVPVYPKRTSNENVPEDQVYYHFASCVYFSDLQSEFEEISPTLNDQVLFLNDQYLSEVTNMQERQSWIKFLTIQIGINRSLRLVQTENKVYARSKELDFAILQATKNAIENDSVATWVALLGHMQKNWEYYKNARQLIKQIKESHSGFHPFPIRSLFPDLKSLKNLLLDENGIPCICLPAIPGLTNSATMSDLEIETTLNGNMLKRLAIHLEQCDKSSKLPIMDLFVWKKIYAAMVQHKAMPKNILIPENDGPGKFESINNICQEIPPMLQEFCNYLQFPANIYAEVHGMKKWIKPELTVQDYNGILFKFLKIDVPCKREYETQILQCYQQMNALMSDGNHGCRTNLVFDKSCLLRGWKTSNRLVMPDKIDIFQKFIVDPKRFCPILFVHPELAKLENMSKHLSASMNIPLLSKLVQICPVPSFWHGYYVFAVGTTPIELPTYLSSNLTNLYRTVLAEFQAKAKTLSDEENRSLGNLLRGILVFVLAVDAPKVPVAYTIYGVSRVCQEDYFIHTSISGQVSVIVSANVLSLPIEEHVNLHVLKELFPPLVVDSYLKTVIKKMLEGSVKPKLETLNIVQPNDTLQMLPFEIIVEDTEVVKSIHEFRQKPSTSGKPAHITNQRNYPIIFAPQGKYAREGIPGLTTRIERNQSDPQRLSNFPFPTPGENPSTPGKTAVNSQHPVNSINHKKENVSTHDHVANHDSVGITSSNHEETVPFSQKDFNFRVQMMVFTNKDAQEFSEAQTESNASSQDFSKTRNATDVLLQDEFKKPMHEIHSGIAPPNAQITNASHQPHSTSSSRSKSDSLDPTATAGHPEVATNAHQPNNIIGTTNAISEGDLPQAFGGNVNSFNSVSSIRRIREEIHSWPKISVEEIEARLFKGGELQYATPNHHQQTSNTDSTFGLNLRRLENEGLVAKLIGIWAEKAVFNHLLHLYNSKRPLQNGSNMLGFPIQSFSMANWISSSRENFDTESRLPDDGKGFDFSYEQTNGTVVYIEVKGHAAMTNSFLLSSNEWEVAKLYSNRTDAIYVILGINLNMISMEGAQIEYFLEDPISLEGKGTIAKKTHSYVIELCSKMHVHPDPATSSSVGVEEVNNKNETGGTNIVKERAILKARRSHFSKHYRLPQNAEGVSRGSNN